ncbi:hypothetical protein ACFLT9_07350 [Acidobacteriota bacterium]
MNNTIARVLLLLIIGGGVCLGWSQSGEEVKAAEISRKLVRIDLLLKEKAELVAPNRNIFIPSPRNVGGQSVKSGSLSQAGTVPSVESGTDPDSQTAQEELTAAVDLKYIGYIRSGSEIIGLITYLGETLAVSKGDWIDDSFRVKDISVNEISILGPDSKEKIFSLEGE